MRQWSQNLTIQILADKLASAKYAAPTRCTRRNGRPADGWSIVGDSGLTRAIKMAKLPHDNFWSGSNPTPSTQAPEDVIEYGRAIILNDRLAHG